MEMKPHITKISELQPSSELIANGLSSSII